MRKIILAALILNGCAFMPGQQPASVERVFVINCGENHVKDVSRWTPGVLSGDMVHLLYSWNNRVVPPFNYDVPQSQHSIDEMKAYAHKTGTRIWVNHDLEQHAKLPKSPQSVE